MEHYFGEATPKLGFGLMRLPKKGMGKIDIEQTRKMVDLFMEAGLNYFDTAYVYGPLNAEEQAAIRKAQEVINGIKSIPCTGCHYCTAGCPKQIRIPEIFAARNKQLVWGQLEEGKAEYAKAVADAGTASDCIACGQCERACPQQIPVIDRLKDCAASFGE